MHTILNNVCCVVFGIYFPYMLKIIATDDYFFYSFM